jgi:tRNA U34 2-thiouridine synthase MnmA/TrmU
LKAVGLLSGGLDSTVAIQMMLDQGIEVYAFNVVTAFCCCTPKDSSCSAARTAVRQLGVDLEVVNVTEEFLPIVADPKHGHGSGMNPCLDCRILMFKKAREYMEEIGASFIVTGDVLGQRPMSQRKDAMRLIDAESGLEGLVLRPLSAALLEPTIPEKEGWVDRDALLAVSGRSRRPQMELAEEMGLKDYPCPAGGCLLTDPIFAERVRDLLEHVGELRLEDVKLLKLGRHFRLSQTAKAAVGRDQNENHRLGNELRDGDYAMEISGQPGPLTLIRGDVLEDDLAVAAAITSRYGKSGGRTRTTVLCRQVGNGSMVSMTVEPVDRKAIRSMMIGGASPNPDNDASTSARTEVTGA